MSVVLGIAAIAFGVVHATDAIQRLAGRRSIADRYPPLRLLTNRAPTHSLLRRGAEPSSAQTGLQAFGGLFMILVGTLFLLGR